MLPVTRRGEAASKLECRKLTKRRKGMKYGCEVYSGKGIKSGFQVPVFFDLFNLSNLSHLIKGTVPLLNPQTPRYSFCMETHRSPSSLTLTTSVHLQKGLYQRKRRVWKTPLCGRKSRVCTAAWKPKQQPRRGVLQFLPFLREPCFSSTGPSLRTSTCKLAVFHVRGNKTVSKLSKAVTTLHKQ